MPPFRPTAIRLAQNAASTARAAARDALAQRAPPAPFPVTPTCPAPTCTCSPMPEGLDIDYSKTLNGTMAPYSSHVLVCTGQSDWKSKIEDEHSTGTWGPFLAGLKKGFGRGGQFHDPYKNVLVSASSWQPEFANGANACEAIVFPSFLHKRFELGAQSTVDEKMFRRFSRDIHDGTIGTGSAVSTEHPRQVRSLEYPTILICSHGGRDSRCGVLGPILQDQFRTLLQKDYGTQLPVTDDRTTHQLDLRKVNVGMISHVGGHKWAGNVIVYVPPGWRISSSIVTAGDALDKQSPLAGRGIWYGRVEPKHIEGIIEETLLKGRVIQELFRGGIDSKGEVLRLP